MKQKIHGDVTIAFDKADFSPHGLRKIAHIICRQQGLDMKNVVFEWPDPLMVATGPLPEYRVVRMEDTC